MKIVNFIKKLQKGGFHTLGLIVGIGFVLFSVLPYLMPGTFHSDTPWFTNLIFLGAGIAAIFFSARGLKDVFTTTVEEKNYFDQVDTSKVDQSVIDQIRNNTKPLKDYYFHFCGKLNQSYILETTDRQPVFEFNCNKIGVVNDFIFTFKDHVSGSEDTHDVSHTITTSYGDESFSIIDKSYFKVDGKNIWEHISEMGYSIEPYLDTIAFSYRVNHYGVQVADIKAAGTNILEQYEDKGGLRNVPTIGGLYRVSCREDDIRAVAIICFAVSRVEIV